jgi:hypothetical protein
MSTSDTSTHTDAEHQAATAAEELKMRLEKRKTELKTKLLATEQVRLKARCKASQAVLTGLSKRLDNTAANHTKAYKAINTKLSTLTPKLDDKGLDTTALKNAQVTLANKIAAYETNLKSYQQAVSDLKTMDCVADPTAFKASLETARSLRQKLHDSAADIRTYVNQTIKPILAQLRAQLAQKESTTEGAQ